MSAHMLRTYAWLFSGCMQLNHTLPHSLALGSAQFVQPINIETHEPKRDLYTSITRLSTGFLRLCD